MSKLIKNFLSFIIRKPKKVSGLTFSNYLYDMLSGIKDNPKVIFVGKIGGADIYKVKTGLGERYLKIISLENKKVMKFYENPISLNTLDNYLFKVECSTQSPVNFEYLKTPAENIYLFIKELRGIIVGNEKLLLV